ncbi:MAG: (2Fe-2S)-binding protein [Deltaproteobacteria bacterium]|jgi:NADH-quinone oxidoreductase subunit G|nr:(2Fe-2S)-binding protein [Deltaproteobacteria bacterium]
MLAKTEKLSPAIIHFTLDNQECQGATGQSVFEALKPYYRLPNLCGEKIEGLGYPCASCGLSVVELEDSGELVRACETPLEAGLKIKSFSPNIRRARLMALKRLVQKHPGKCLLCEKSGQCRLQTLCADLGLALTSLPNPDPVLTLVPAGASDLPSSEARPKTMVKLVGANRKDLQKNLA